MTALVTCRECGTDFEIDVLNLDGHWWDHCPSCTKKTAAEATPDESSAADDEQWKARDKVEHMCAEVEDDDEPVRRVPSRPYVRPASAHGRPQRPVQRGWPQLEYRDGTITSVR
jgi:hypothetical protein